MGIEQFIAAPRKVVVSQHVNVAGVTMSFGDVLALTFKVVIALAIVTCIVASAGALLMFVVLSAVGAR